MDDADAALAERLKDMAADLDLCALKATRRRTGDTWRTIEVRHASPMWSDAPDGWDVEIKEHGL